MSYGARVRSPNGNLQIDEDYINLALAYKGTFRTGSVNSGGTASGSVELEGTGLTVALASENAIGMVGSSESGGKTRFSVTSDVANSVIEYYVFREAELGQNFNSRYGIRTRNNAGQVVFDSRKKYLSVLDSYYNQEGQSAPWTSRDYGRKVALVITQWYTSANVFSSPTTPGRETVVTTFFGAKTPGNTCQLTSVTNIQESSGGVGSGIVMEYSGMPRARSLLVVDVSDF